MLPPCPHNLMAIVDIIAAHVTVLEVAMRQFYRPRVL
jgi:hypothetical protein